MSERSIIHIDMDAFYASVEQRDFPQYRGKPLIVGGDPNHRGVVATCSYEARKFGIHSAMACAMAKRKCPHAIFVQPRFQIYREVSTNIQDILRKYTDLIEPLALDEAFLDVTKQIVRSGSSMLIAKDICQRIKRETHLTASAGVSYNKFLAKIASDRGKPDGLFYVSPKEGPEFVKKLTIREFFGVGPATEEKMQGVGKSKSVECLLEPLSEFTMHLQLGAFSDPFMRKSFSENFAVIFDEMTGANKADIEAI